MKSIINIMKDNKNISLLIVIVLVITSLGISYAFFSDTAQIDTPSTQGASVISDEEATLTINKTTTDLSKVSGTDYSTFTINAGITLKAPEQYQTTYDLYLQINKNTYTGTSNSNAKILLKVTNNEGLEIMSIDNIERVTVGSITGFNLTDINNVIKISNSSNIATSTSTTQNWILQIYVYDLDGTGEIDLSVELNKETSMETILSDNGGIDNIKSETAIDLSKIGVSQEVYDMLPDICDTDNCASKEKASVSIGLYSTEDNYGTSYFYRGDVDNNWIYFANYYWKIVRINGDNSIRLIYAGDRKPTESEKVSILGEEAQVGTSIFNDNANREWENWGYMYTDNEQFGTSNDSDIKIYLDNWYQNNILEYDKYIADNLFCGERKLVSEETLQTATYNEINFDSTTYNYISEVRKRLKNDLTATLVCDNKLDSYTVTDNINGNSALSYKIGLISADEMVYAGNNFNKLNPYNYLYTGIRYHSISPSAMSFTVGYSSAFMMYETGHLGLNNTHTEVGVRPVINITANSYLEGKGTWDDPYELQFGN